MKQFYLVRRNAAIPPDEFIPRWRAHSALAAQFPGLTAQFERVTYLVATDGSTGYDGVGILRIPSLESARIVRSDPDALSTIQPDEQRVFGALIADVSTFAREDVILQPVARTSSACVVTFQTCPARGDVEEFHEEQIARLAEAARAESSGVVGATYNRVVAPPWDTMFHFDAVTELWLATPDAAVAHPTGANSASATGPSAPDVRFVGRVISHWERKPERA